MTANLVVVSKKDLALIEAFFWGGGGVEFHFFNVRMCVCEKEWHLTIWGVDSNYINYSAHQLGEPLDDSWA